LELAYGWEEALSISGALKEIVEEKGPERVDEN